MERIINFNNEIKMALQQDDGRTFREIFLNLHPMDQAAIYLDMDRQQHLQIQQHLTPSAFAGIFQALDLQHQEKAVEEMDDAYIAHMFEAMYADNVADFLERQDAGYREKIISLMTGEGRAEVRELLDYAEDSAGTIMTKEYIAVLESDTVGEVMEKLSAEATRAVTIYYVYVIGPDHRLKGVASLRELIIAPDDAGVGSIMQTHLISAGVDDDQEDVAKVIQKYDLIALPVVTDQGLLAGIVTVDDILDVVHIEIEEDFGELGTTRGAMDYNLTIFQSAKKRGPWIIMLMLLGMITANIIGAFEETLEAVVLLSAFIPLIMDSAGNTGTQALTVAVRNLALGNIGPGSVLKTLGRELGTGFLIGAASAVALMILIPIFYPDGGMMFAAIVGLTLVTTLSLSAVVGALIPLIIKKLHIDPAVASGPFITTINDIMGLLIYFTIATTLLGQL
ncbi:magnesium transporter [Lacicoccus alkaliphilus]|uniref:Magnesium transporter MgtE n=1 Tax=Lacicoccus alkaliphilus DSM 16010 TaxID=1123231 RepID=A0A1M7JT88_9BACL|nr:magnesium transporter [Salinicoccus alkaliphilus]SHM56198.1 magnesium transporter [Salinicoccus alkaliphilus DSM 16010]